MEKKEKNLSLEKKIVLKMLLERGENTDEFRIPAEITKILRLDDAKQVFITLYGDSTINLERLPEELFVKVPEKVEIAPPAPAKLPLKKKPLKPKVPVKKIPTDWIPLAKTYFLTPESDIRRPNGRLVLRKEKVIEAARVFKSSPTREEAVRRFADELNWSKSVIGVLTSLIKKSLPHLEKMLTEKMKTSEEKKPEEKKPEPEIEAPPELIKVIQKKEEEEI